jgi:predicted secreted hydrolase
MPRVLAAVLLAAVLVVAPAAAADQPVSLPRDHGAHGASIEWWYFTAFVRDPQGTPYSVFFTLFSSSGFVLPVAQVRNVRTGKLIGHSESTSLFVPGGGPGLNAGTPGSRLRYDAASDTWRFTVSEPGLHVTLSQHATKPYVLHGRGGVIRQSVAGTSHYYSATRMRASGTLRVDGKQVPITGQSWFDHQWGGFRNDPRAFDWNWFSCRFDDGRELMLYQFLDRKTGRPLTAYTAGTYVDRNGRSTAVHAFTATPRGEELTAAGNSWPLDWRLQVPSLHLSESLVSLVPDQLVRNALVPTFWEGAASARGTHGGICFVENSRR